MASTLRLSLLVVVAALAVSLCSAQAPAPAPAGLVNLTDILVKGGQFTTFLRLLNVTQVLSQITNQLNSSTEGMTLLAPSDNAFQNLKPGLINGLTMQQQVQLVLAHVLPKFYSFDDFQTISNPVRTQGSGSDGEQDTVEIISTGNRQFNVTAGKVTSQVNNALREAKPLAVYQVDKVLIPTELLGGAKAPKSAPASSETPNSSNADSPARSSTSADAEAPSAGNGLKSLGMGIVAAVGFFTAGLLL